MQFGVQTLGCSSSGELILRKMHVPQQESLQFPATGIASCTTASQHHQRLRQKCSLCRQRSGSIGQDVLVRDQRLHCGLLLQSVLFSERGCRKDSLCSLHPCYGNCTVGGRWGVPPTYAQTRWYSGTNSTFSRGVATGHHLIDVSRIHSTVTNLFRHTKFTGRRQCCCFQARAQPSSRATQKESHGQYEDNSKRKNNVGNRRNYTTEREKAELLERSKAYPMVRAYRNDLCTLEVNGDTLPWQAIAAMAADGGRTASEELAKGEVLMTIESLIPGRSADHSSISTQLLAPTRMVVERAKTIWARKRAGSTSSGSAFARAFEAVVMQQLLKFELCFHSAGTSRDMYNLAHEEIGTVTSLKALDGRALDTLGEAVCNYALACMKESVQQKALEGGNWTKLLQRRQKLKWLPSAISAVRICPLSAAEMSLYADRLLEDPDILSNIHTEGFLGVRPSHAWWPMVAPGHALGKQCFEAQVNEYVPAHKLHVDLHKLNVNVVGGQQMDTDGIWEFHLTHAQLVDLADVLDLYYEDQFTCPGKKLCTGLDLKVPHYSWKKFAESLWVAALASVLGGALLIGLVGAARLRNVSSASAVFRESSPVSVNAVSDSSLFDKWRMSLTNEEPVMPVNKEVPQKEMEVLCGLVVAMVKDALDWPYDIESQAGQGAWMGTNLTQWEKLNLPRQWEGYAREGSLVSDTHSQASVAYREGDIVYPEYKERTILIEEVSSIAAAEEKPIEVVEKETSTLPQKSDLPSEQNILLFQLLIEAATSCRKAVMLAARASGWVVISRDGKLLGFKPGNESAITRWASFPLATMLHKVQKLGAGLFERSCVYKRPPSECVVLELLVRDHSTAPSVSARPFQLSK